MNTEQQATLGAHDYEDESPDYVLGASMQRDDFQRRDERLKTSVRPFFHPASVPEYEQGSCERR